MLTIHNPTSLFDKKTKKKGMLNTWKADWMYAKDMFSFIQEFRSSNYKNAALSVCFFTVMIRQMHKSTNFLLILILYPPAGALWSCSQPSIWQLSCCKNDWDVCCRRLRTWCEKLSAGTGIILGNEKSYSKTQRLSTRKTCAQQQETRRSIARQLLQRMQELNCMNSCCAAAVDKFSLS